MFLDDKKALKTEFNPRDHMSVRGMGRVAIATGAVLLAGLFSPAAATGITDLDLAASDEQADHSLAMAMLLIGFISMAIAGRAVRRRTVKDLLAAESRRWRR